MCGKLCVLIFVWIWEDNFAGEFFIFRIFSEFVPYIRTERCKLNWFEESGITLFLTNEIFILFHAF